MSTRYSPKITTDGLMFVADAANRMSYTGSGTVWYNVVDPSVSGSLVNSPIFTNEFGGGTFTFTGSNYVTFGCPPQMAFFVPITICGWFNQSSVTTANTIFSAYSFYSAPTLLYIVRLDSGQFEFYSSRVSPPPYYNQYATNVFPSLNQWHWFAVSLSGNTTSAVCTVYIDTTFVGSLNFSNLTTIPAYSTTPIAIGCSQFTVGAGEFFTGKIPLIQVYNRALSKNEVYQNYHAQKGRYGLL